jgi:DNA-binding Lrp family transcriptional regulator
MNFNYTVKSIKIKSNWFDMLDRKKSTYQKITYKGLNLYFQLHKFRLYNQENEYTFITSISLLRKETGYSTEEVFDLLKKLKGAKIIKIENVSRWDYLIDEKGNIRDKDILVITAIDLPKTEKKARVNSNGEVKIDQNGNTIYYDSPVTKDDYYIAVSFDMLELYKKKKLNERYYALYCLILKWSNGYIDGKFNMSIEKIAKTLDFDKDNVNRMIYQMNRNYVLSSYRERRKGRDGYRYNHYLLTTTDPEKMERWIKSEKENMDKLIRRVDKKKNSKKSIDIEKEMETVEVEETKESKVKWGFGKRKGEVWGEDSPFDNVSDESIVNYDENLKGTHLEGEDLSWVYDLD